VIFLYFNWQGIKHHTVGYLLALLLQVRPKTMGDWLLGILLFPVELISTAARILSLTVRLWANIFASDLLYVIFLACSLHRSPGAGKSRLCLAWHSEFFRPSYRSRLLGCTFFVAIIQTYVFTLLPSIYIGIATADEH